MASTRRYRAVLDRLAALDRRFWRRQPLGAVAGYPLELVVHDRRRGAPTVLLSGGMHGEEPAGVEGVLQWLESGRAGAWPVNWWVLPCINPYGWERHQRTNFQRRDINRQFRGPTDCPEARLLKRLFGGRRFLFSFEFHEDVDASGYYLYELRRRPPFVGEQVLAAVRRVVPINRDPIIDGNEATGAGLIRRHHIVAGLRQRRRWPMAFHLYLHHTDHILGSETAVDRPLSRRARAHQVALAAVLDAVARDRG